MNEMNPEKSIDTAIREPNSESGDCQRILMLSNEFPPIGGGAATITEEVLKLWPSYSSTEVDLITASAWGRPCTTMNVKGVRLLPIFSPQLDIHHANLFDLGWYATTASIRAIFRCLRIRYNGTFAWSIVPAAIPSYILLKLFKIPYVIWAAGPDIPGYETRYALLTKLISPILKKLWNNAHSVIVKSLEEAELIRQAGYLGTLLVIRNGVDVPHFVVAEMRKQSKKYKILCVARLIERKGQETLIRATRALIDRGINAELILVGNGDSKKRYEKLIAELQITENVKLLGAVTRAEMPGIYADADIFALATHSDSMSVAILEALASGLPIVTTRHGGVSDVVIEDDNGFLVAPTDAIGFADKLELLFRNSEKRFEFGEKSAQRAQSFSWDFVTSEMAKTVDLVLKTQSKSN